MKIGIRKHQQYVKYESWKERRKLAAKKIGRTKQIVAWKEKIDDEILRKIELDIERIKKSSEALQHKLQATPQKEKMSLMMTIMES